MGVEIRGPRGHIKMTTQNIIYDKGTSNQRQAGRKFWYDRNGNFSRRHAATEEFKSLLFYRRRFFCFSVSFVRMYGVSDTDKILLRKKQTAKRETKLPSASGNRIQQRRYYSGGTDGYGCSLPFIVVVVVVVAAVVVLLARVA